jgi:tetratricopeptide (TPR) repeat protein
MNIRKLTSVVFLLFAFSLLLFSVSGCTAKAKRARHLARADKYYASGDYLKAEVEYLNVLRLDQANAHAIRRLGTIAFDDGLFFRALPFLVRAAELSTNDVDTQVKLATICVTLAALKDGYEKSSLVLTLEPTNAEAPLLLAQSATNQSQGVEARQRLETIQTASGGSAAIQLGLGTLSFRAGDLGAAEAAFRKAVSLDPKSSAAHFALGNLLAARNDVNGADAEFKTATDSAPLRSARRIGYANFEIQRGQIDVAKRLLKELTKACPDYVPAVLRQIEIAISEKQFDQAASMINAVLARDNGNYEARMLKSRLLILKSEPLKAIRELDLLAGDNFYRKLPQFHYQLAIAHLANTNDMAKALVSLNQALALNPNFEDAVLLQAQLNIARGDTVSAISALTAQIKRQPRLVQARLALATAYTAKGDLDQAASVYKQLEDMFPKYPEPPFQMGLIHLQQNRNDEARSEFLKTLDLAAGFLPAVEKLVDIDLLADKYSDAEARAQEQVANSPQAPEPRLLMAKVRMAKAESLISAAAKKEKDPPSVDTAALLAHLPEAQTNIDLAKADLVKAIELNPTNQQPYLLLARVYLTAKKDEKALQQLSDALAKDPKDIRALMLTATIHEGRKDFPAARKAYERLLQVKPTFYPALNNLAYLYSEKFNELDKAYEIAQKARELLTFKGQTGDDSTQSSERGQIEFLRAFSTDTLGWIVFKRGDYGYAFGLLQESARILSSEPEVQFHFGMACYMTGREEQAKAALQRSLDFKKDFTGITDAKARLAILAFDPAASDPTAVAALERQLHQQPGDPIALTRLARYYEQIGEPDKAIKACNQALNQNRKNLPVLLRLAALYSKYQHNPAEALQLAKEAYKLGPEDPEVAVAVGRLAFETGGQGAYKWAYSLLQPAASRHSDDPEFLYDLAMVTYSIGKVDDAVATMGRVVQLAKPFSRQAEAKDFLELAPASVHPELAEAQQARATAILKKEPDNVSALMVVALCSKIKGDTASAQQSFEKALAQYPEFVPVWNHLAQLYLAQGQTQKAYDLAAKAREALPDDPQVAKTLGIALYQREDYRNSARLLDECARKGSSDGELLYYVGMNQYQLLKERKEQTKERRAQLVEGSRSALQQALAMNIQTKLAADARRILAELN